MQAVAHTSECLYPFEETAVHMSTWTTTRRGHATNHLLTTHGRPLQLVGHRQTQYRPAAQPPGKRSPDFLAFTLPSPGTLVPLLPAAVAAQQPPGPLLYVVGRDRAGWRRTRKSLSLATIHHNGLRYDGRQAADVGRAPVLGGRTQRSRPPAPASTPLRPSSTRPRARSSPCRRAALARTTMRARCV